jgi:hypothetical protein
MDEKIKDLQNKVSRLLRDFEEENNLSIKAVKLAHIQSVRETKLIGAIIIFGAKEGL